MNRILAGALALSLLSGAGAGAQPYNHDNGRHDERASDNRGGDDRGHDDRGHDNGRHDGQGRSDRHQWRQGERLPSTYRTRSHYVDYRAHHLRAPPRGYRWVQADDNYALVAVTSGLIASIIASSN